MAQVSQTPSLSLEIASDYRDRGLSWSRGAPTAILSGRLPLPLPLHGGVMLSGRAAALRGSSRAGGAELGTMLALRYGAGTVARLSGGVTMRGFAGRDWHHFWEADARVDYDIGPATLSAGMAYAPSQHVIGGDNLHLDIGASLALPGTPVTLMAGLGHSSGARRGEAHPIRLRPGGSYADWRLGAEYRTGRHGVGVSYTDTSPDRGASHAGARATAYLRVDF